MTNPKLCLTLCVSLLPGVAFAASAKERSADALTRAVTASTLSETPLSQPADSAGRAESLPDLPETHLPALSLRSVPQSSTLITERLSRFSFTTQQGQGVSPLASMPLAGTARRLGAQRFNTDDGSMLDDFAICYRMSRRSSVEIIPGDPAPVRLPVVSMANNTGVTVGLVLRLSK